jgi:hypothetical protein
MGVLRVGPESGGRFVGVARRTAPSVGLFVRYRASVGSTEAIRSDGRHLEAGASTCADRVHLNQRSDPTVGFCPFAIRRPSPWSAVRRFGQDRDHSHPPGDDDPGEPKAAVPSAGRDHDGGCESKPGSADGGFSQTTATQIVESASPSRSPEAGGGLVNEGRRASSQHKPDGSSGGGLAGWLTMEAGPLAGVGGPPRQPGGPVAPLEGEATPARSARNLTAVGKSHLLT